jgi:hypothetical protein
MLPTYIKQIFKSEDVPNAGDSTEVVCFPSLKFIGTVSGSFNFSV